MPVPVEFTSFTASVDRSGSVVLEWVTESEIENLGFILERRDEIGSSSSSPQDPGEWGEIANYITHPELQGQGSVTYRTEYSYTDDTVEVGKTYNYRLADVSYAGDKDYHSLMVLSVNVTAAVPDRFVLHPAYPNPFNPITVIEYDLPKESHVTLVVYDVTGREVATLADGLEQAGRSSVSWNGKDDLGQPVGAGVYLYRIQADRFSRTRKMVLLK